MSTTINPAIALAGAGLEGVTDEDMAVVATLAEHGYDVAVLAAELVLARASVTAAHVQVKTGGWPVTPGTARALSAVAVQLTEELAQFRRTLRELV